MAKLKIKSLIKLEIGSVKAALGAGKPAECVPSLGQADPGDQIS